MSSSNDEFLCRSAETASLSEKGGMVPTYSFTEAVRNIHPNRFQPPTETFSEATENLSGAAVDSATEYEILREYLDDQLEELCFMQIEGTFGKYCGLPNERVLDIGDEVWDPVSENAIGVDWNCVDYNDIEYKELEYDNLDHINDIEYNRNIDCFSTYGRKSFYNQPMSYESVYEYSPQWRNVSDDRASLNYYKQRPTPMLQMAECHLKGFGAKQDEDNFVGKRRLCRHFLKGRCNRGNACDFLHDESIFCSDEQKVFLGGLSAHITDKELREALVTQGYTVLNKPKVLQGFSPQICLGSVEEAQSMIRRGKVVIEGAFVDVRPYEAFVKDSLKMGTKGEIKRSVFLGGLSGNTTGWMIKERLSELGFVTANHPVVKSGFAPQVLLESIEQAKRLVELKKITINKSTVEIRPYSRFRV